ncbi:uncharacterized protein [Euphorbia lathyris]|uniref:uncharacterized protein n=1 Tax=Euphorbia lathyris TaxID=212925 RepID=UPI00331353EA
MALSIAKPKHRSLTNPSLIHLFSSSPYQDAPNSPSQSPSEEQQQQTSYSSYFSHLKASLKEKQENQQSDPHLTTPGNVNPSISKSAGDSAPFDGIKKNLQEFPRRSNTAGQPNSDQQNQPFVLFQDLYKRHANVKSQEGTVTTQSSPNYANSSISSFAAIRDTLGQLRINTSPKPGSKSGDPVSFSDLSGRFKLKPESEKGPLESTVIGGTQELPLSMSTKEQMTGKDNRSIEFVKMYNMNELGDKLRNLRPELKEKGWFSLEELRERLRKLRTMEVEEMVKSRPGIPIQALRDSLEKIKEQDSLKKDSIPRLNILGQLGGPDFMAYPPQEHLVEKYFHPDNMSSAEKLKLELSNVREEFKMSESDCGSARVQVAQLTTKIKHLSSVLHKKDKHSRKGLQEMVQRRKKLLKYLRRTDWDSYCFVLSKLGLRDNAEMKH